MLKKIIGAVLFAAVAAVRVFADGNGLPPVPEQVFAGCINGRVNIWVSNDGSLTNHWFQMRLPHESDDAWRTVAFERTGNSDPGLAYWAFADFPGEAYFRVADTNAAGEHAGWLTTGPLTNHVRHVGWARGVVGNGYTTNIIDGVVVTVQESSDQAHHANSSNVWYGIEFNYAATVGKIRFVPRQSPSVGLNRVVGNVFECADDIYFTNPVRLAVVPQDIELGGVCELVLAEPVTAKFFRMSHQFKKDNYISIAELEFVPTELKYPIDISVTPDDSTNMVARIDWSVPAGNPCTTAVVERAHSPEGPFKEISDWSDASSGGTCRDTAAAVGVPCYYRVRTWCEGGLSAMFLSDPVKYVRSRRLERDPREPTVLLDGVSVYSKPFALEVNYVAAAGAGTEKNAFDGDVTTAPELSCYTNTPMTSAHRSYNPVIGVDLGEGAAFHVAMALAYPRANNLPRARYMAVYGANADDLSDRVQLSPVFGGFSAAAWQYNTVTDLSGSFRYVFLFSPNNYATYGNVAEVGFYGFTDQDVIDSGVVIPPELVTAEAGNTAVRLSWSRGWNHASFAVDRRKAGDGEWSRIATGIDPAVSEYLDDDPGMRKGVYEYRLVAVAGAEEAWSPRTACEYSPKRGLIITVH